MSYDKIATICFISVCALLAGVIQSIGAFACLAVGITLFGFILWLDRNRLDKATEIQAHVKQLEERIQMISLSRMVR